MRPHRGQRQALSSTARFILVLAGLQSGKTLTGPWWMLREMALCGPGDYLGAGPTFPLLQMKCLPEYETLFERRLGWGRLYKGYPPILELNEKGRRHLFAALLERGDTSFADTETRIIFGAGIKPESLESATVKAAHLDEAGQKQFLRASHEAVLGRLAIHRGRILYTTTPYQLGWLKAEVYDRAANERALPPEERTYELVQFASTMNPAFPEAEFEEMRQKLPAWKFNMRYRGRFERPAGLIYDCFRRDVHTTPAEPVPKDWPRYAGLDFGGVNTAAIKVAREPGTPRYVAYVEYHAGGRTAREHAAALQAGEPSFRRVVGGAKSEGQWRREFKQGGMTVREPGVSEVEVGIDRVYELLKNHPEMHRVEGFEGAQHDPSRPYLEIHETLGGLLDEMESYSRVLNDEGEPTEKIEDKSTYHRLDALRYLGTYLNSKRRPAWGKP
ncbi:MAG: terminase [Bacteroidetes bacterium]|nr:terminase [Bacteroidota bacterium]